MSGSITFEEAYYVGYDHSAFRRGELAKIEGVVIAEAERQPSTPCFRLVFEDGFVYFAPIGKTYGYKIVTKEEWIDPDQELALKQMCQM